MQTRILDLLGVLVPAILAACHLADALTERQTHFEKLYTDSECANYMDSAS